MAAYLISVQLQLARNEAYELLKAATEKENFKPLNTDSTGEKMFSYYGNQDLLYVNESVKRAVLTTGQKFCFSVIKDNLAEKQYHTKEKSFQGF